MDQDDKSRRLPVNLKPRWQKMPVVPRGKTSTRNATTYRAERRNNSMHPFTDAERKKLIREGKIRGSH
jgi:hypothetical protein